MPILGALDPHNNTGSKNRRPPMEKKVKRTNPVIHRPLRVDGCHLKANIALENMRKNQTRQFRVGSGCSDCIGESHGIKELSLTFFITEKIGKPLTVLLFASIVHSRLTCAIPT